MSLVHLAGTLRCRTAAEAGLLQRHLPDHIRQTRAEPGCIAFDVTPEPGDPLRWRVREIFIDRPAFLRHQARSKASPWGLATAGVLRDWQIRGASDLR